MEKATIIENICLALQNGKKEKAEEIARSSYPFQYFPKLQRKISDVESVKIFSRAGFIDRYSGRRLIFPGVLHLLSVLMPEDFPYHDHWKMSECHIVYYELQPAIDHVIPIARGGLDEESNWVTTSMMRNSAKSNWTLEELGWSLLPPGNIEEWDGLMGFYVDYYETSLEKNDVTNPVRHWYKLAKSIT